jgi:hypothetical protein
VKSAGELRRSRNLKGAERRAAVEAVTSRVSRDDLRAERGYGSIKACQASV